jgi:uncharacterized membrane protein YbhN (UPF0104 family)
MLAGMRSRRRVLLRGALGLALVAAVFAWVLPQIASYGSVAHELATISAAWAVGLAAATVLDVLTLPLPWRALLPQLSWLSSIGFTQASTALSTVLPGGAPIGMAISFGLLRRLQIGPGPAGFAVALTGLWSQVLIFLYPLVGTVLVLGSGQLSASTLVITLVSGAAAAAIVGIAVAALRSPAAARWLGDTAARAGAWFMRLFHRPAPNWSGEALVRLRTDRLELLRRRWGKLTLTTLANHLTAYLVFDLSLRAVGVSAAQIPPSQTFLAWSIGRLISSLPLTPGGLGVVELGLIGTLVGFGGPHARVVAAVLLYRALIVGPTLVLGAVSLVTFRFRNVVTPAAD